MSELDERADALQDGASQFEKQAGKLKNKFWLQNIKFIIAGAIVGLLILILLYFKFSDDQHPPPQYYNQPHHGPSVEGGRGGGAETSTGEEASK